MASAYRIQIVEMETGEVLELYPGLLANKEFIDDLCARIADKGVGVGRTSAHVLADVRMAVQEQFRALKELAPPSRRISL